MSFDSDSDDDVGALFDAFDQVDTEDVNDCEFVKENTDRQKVKVDAYDGGLTPAQKDEIKLDLLKRKRAPERPEENPYSSPAKRKRPSGVIDMGVMPEPKKTTKTTTENEPRSSSSDICPLSGINLRNRECPIHVVEQTMGIAKFTHLHYLAGGHDAGEVEIATIGVVVQKIQPQTVDKKGNPFTIFSFSNLRDIPKVIKIMAFGEFHKSFWKTQVGAVVLLVNPKKLPDRDGGKYENAPSFTLQGPDSFKVIGFASDLGTCSGKTMQGQKCRNFVNLSVSQMCPTHVLKQFNRACAQRGELSAKTGSYGIADKNKGTEWQKHKKDFFFAGGKTFQALPPSQNPACSTNGKLDFIANTHAKKGVKDTAKEMRKNPGIVVMSAPGGVRPKAAEDTSMMIQSSKHGGRLLAAALGRGDQNKSLMQSKSLKQTDSKISTITASELLRMKNEEFLVKKREILKQRKLEAALKQTNNSSPTTKGLGNLTLTGAAPKGLFSHLAQSNSASSSKDRAKLRAAALFNAAKSPDTKKLAILKKVSTNCDISGPKAKEKVEEKLFMGQKTSSINTKEIFKMKSKYQTNIDDLMSAEQDFYFSILEKKEEAQTKMDGVMRADAQVVTCKDCKYTYWSPHANCKLKNHDLVWKKATKRWFKCKSCPTQRAVSFAKYPKNNCAGCGHGTRWVRCDAGDTNRTAAKDADGLLLRGEEKKWANS